MAMSQGHFLVHLLVFFAQNNSLFLIHLSSGGTFHFQNMCKAIKWSLKIIVYFYYRIYFNPKLTIIFRLHFMVCSFHFFEFPFKLITFKNIFKAPKKTFITCFLIQNDP
jgi:nitrate reductase gamma subunit